MENNNQYSSESQGNQETYSSSDSKLYNSETESKLANKDENQKYQIAKPKRVIIKARLIND